MEQIPSNYANLATRLDQDTLMSRRMTVRRQRRHPRCDLLDSLDKLQRTERFEGFYRTIERRIYVLWLRVVLPSRDAIQ